MSTSALSRFVNRTLSTQCNRAPVARQPRMARSRQVQSRLFAAPQWLNCANNRSYSTHLGSVHGPVDHHGLGTIYGTTILSVRKDGKVVMIGDGQMTLGSTVVKSKTVKVRRIQNVLVGVAGSTADALTLLEKFEKYLDESNGQLLRATVGLAKQWRTDKMMGKLQAVMCLSDHSTTLLFDGEGNIIEPDDGRILAIGSGGSFALSAARALIDHSPLDAESIARESMKIAADLCIYTNSNFTSITLDAPPKPDDQPFV